MKTIICSIYDSATAAYMRPFTAISDGHATRMLSDELEQPGNPMANHAEDYSLFRIGEFNDENGEIIVCPPTCLARCHELMALTQAKRRREAQPEGQQEETVNGEEQ